MSIHIDIPQQQITELAIFDSGLRDDFGSDSDVDVLGFAAGLTFSLEQNYMY